MKEVKAGKYVFVCENQVELYRAETFHTKEEGTVKWLSETLKPGDVFCDVGANIGLYTVLGADLVGDAGAVYAFEPHVVNAGRLLGNVRRNGLERRVSLISSALHDNEGFLPFNYTVPKPGYSGSQLGHCHGEDGKDFVPAVTEIKHATTLDALIRSGAIKVPQVIKIDVDGNELFILNGMIQLLTSSLTPVRSLQVEVHRDSKARIFDFLKACDYEPVLRHDTQNGKKAIAGGADPEAVPHNQIFRKVSR